jgi:hypothetical protein
VGNCGGREPGHELIRAAQPSEGRVVGWVSRAGNRSAGLSGLSHRSWVTDFGDTVVKMESPCRYRARVRKSAGTHAAERATGTLRVRETKFDARATERRMEGPGPTHRKATGGESGSRARRFGGRLESSSRRVEAETRPSGFSREIRCGRARSAIAQAKARREKRRERRSQVRCDRPKEVRAWRRRTRGGERRAAW